MTSFESALNQLISSYFPKLYIVGIPYKGNEYVGYYRASRIFFGKDRINSVFVPVSK
jgi:hypothetical protein